MNRGPILATIFMLLAAPAHAALRADAALLTARELAERGDRGAALGTLEGALAQQKWPVMDAIALQLGAATYAAEARDRARAKAHLTMIQGLLPGIPTAPELPLIRLRAALLYRGLGDLRSAEPLLVAALPALIAQRSAAAADAGNALGLVQLELLQPAEAVAAFQRGLAVPDAGAELRTKLLINLADAELQVGNLAAAESALARFDAQIASKPLESTAASSARSAARLVRAQLLLRQARVREAEALLEQAAADTPRSELRGNALWLLAKGRFDRGQMPEAARTGLAAVAAYQESTGDWQPALARTLHLLGNAYGELRDRTTAKMFFSRAAAIEEEVFGQRSPQAQATELEWAWIELQEGSRDDAARRSAMAASVLDGLASVNPRLAGLSRVMAGSVAEAYGRQEEAVSRFREGQQLIGRAGPAGKADRGFSLVRLGRLLTRMGRLRDAQPPLEAAVALYRELGSTGTTRLADALVARAELKRAQGDRRGALEDSRSAFAMLRDLLDVGAGGEDGVFRRGAREVLADHSRLLIALASVGSTRDEALLEEAFEATQEALMSRAGEALRQATLRQGAGRGALAALLRDRAEMTDRLAQLSVLERAAAQRTGPEAAQEGERARRERAEIRQARRELDGRLQQEMPGFAAYVRPQPISLQLAREAVPPDAVAVATLATDNGLLVWGLTREKVSVASRSEPDSRIAELVGQVRAGVDPRLGQKTLRSGSMTDRLSPGERVVLAWGTRSGLAPVSRGTEFGEGDVEAARALYTAIFGPMNAVIAGKEQLIFIPDGALQSIPPTLFIGGEPEDMLASRFAVTVMPSIGTLVTLRPTLERSSASGAFLGIGNPEFRDGQPGVGRAASPELWQRLVNLPPLQETQTELTRIASLFPSAETKLLLGAEATKPRIAASGPDRYRTLAFATHAVMAGNLPGIDEPAIVLTPIADDPAAGLLTASDVAAMTLNADMVLLSACNTAGPDGGPYAEGLSGLGRAFLHAGARSMLVSHWPVNSAATEQLMIDFMTALHSDPAHDKAVALQKAIRGFRTSAQQELRSPTIWAPFVLVGR